MAELRSTKVLVVEDNKDASLMICDMLKYHIGCEVLTAYNGEECLSAVKEKAPDVILLDIHMPKMDGFQVCKILKEDEQTKHIPIIFLTASVDDIKSKIKGLELGADDYLVQPINNLELITRIKVMLRIKRLIDQALSSHLSREVAHDLRAPLNSIIGMADLIQKPFYGILTEKQKEFVQIISNSGQELLNRINEFSDGR
ncbi:MAG: response regulator [Candidatus Brocadiia bacterium]|nr:MAG: response regulator [Candidatus Brocadiia bacterium]